MQARHHHASHPAIVFVVGTNEGAAAIDGDLVAVVGKARADLLGEALKAAVAIGNAASSDDGNVHGRSY